MRPLTGTRVLDLADEPAVFAARILADLGADVIRVEHPSGGRVRGLAPFLNDEPGVERSYYHLYHNANKRSVALDIESEPGRESLKLLAAQSDVLLETQQPGRMAELGLGYEELSKLNPGLIHVSVTPHGQDGPWKDRIWERPHGRGLQWADVRGGTDVRSSDRGRRRPVVQDGELCRGLWSDDRSVRAAF